MVYRFSNITITNEYISADVYENQQYMMHLKDHILHIKYTELKTELYKQFQQVARFHLADYDGESELEDESDSGSNVIKWDFRKKPK